MILKMTRLFMNGHSLSTFLLLQTKTSWTSRRVAVSLRPSSQMVQSTRPSVLGTVFQLTFCQRMLIGEIWTVVTICPGTRISTFLAIVAPAGLKVQLLLSLTDLTFWITWIVLPLLALMLKQLLTVRLAAVVMVETLRWYMNTLTTTVSLTALASSTSP